VHLRSLAVALLAGIGLGLLSRLTDTASWAPIWIGYVFSPWFIAAWLAGATVRIPRIGAILGVAILLATAVAYLALAAFAGDVLVLATLLIPLAFLAGPIFGAAGAAWRCRGPWASRGGALLGVAVFAESIALQLVVNAPLERVALVGESLVGIGLSLTLVARAMEAERGR